MFLAQGTTSQLDIIHSTSHWHVGVVSFFADGASRLGQDYRTLGAGDHFLVVALILPEIHHTLLALANPSGL